ncbi:MAG: transmembrane 220 family protein [Bacteroidota bacterium]
MYLRLAIAALLLLFTYFQLNDPDPWAWVALYGVAGVATGVSAFRSLPPWLPLAGLLVCAAGFCWLLPHFYEWIKMGMPTIASSMKAEAPHIELTREFLGLVILLVVWWWLRK